MQGPYILMCDDLQQRFATINKAICCAGEKTQLGSTNVTCLAVSKAQPAESIRSLYGLGQRAFGESYVQEALTKIQGLSDLDIQWHFIGAIQSNKTRDIATHFSWVQSIDRLKIATRLARQRPEDLPDLNICLQVNISDEVTKRGVRESEVSDLAQALNEVPRLRLRGLMAIPLVVKEEKKQREQFAKLYELFISLKDSGLPLDTLSMGMSNDFQMAILEGSTMVRIGSGIFGSRNG